MRSPQEREDLAAGFAERGFVVSEPLLSEAELVPLQAAVQEIFLRCAASMSSLEAWLERVNQVRDPELWHPRFAELKQDPRLSGVAERALGGPVEAAWLHLVWKRPGCDLILPWHVDRPTWPEALQSREAAALWLALDAAGEGAGGLRYVCGSHLPEFAEGEIVTPEVPPGAALLHHPDVLHTSAGNATAGWRRACVLVFARRAL